MLQSRNKKELVWCIIFIVGGLFILIITCHTFSDKDSIGFDRIYDDNYSRTKVTILKKGRIIDQKIVPGTPIQVKERQEKVAKTIWFVILALLGTGLIAIGIINILSIFKILDPYK